MRKMDLYDGKYTIINELENGGGLRALRYGEEWRDLAGDNLILALFQELEKAKEAVKITQEALEGMVHIVPADQEYQDIAMKALEKVKHL